MQGTIKEIDEAKANGQAAPPHSTDYEVACTVLDFLFASQDASTASLTWCIHYMCQYNDVLQRIRDEQQLIRPNHEPFTTEVVNSLVFTNQVMRELLRDRPPATMVPHIALQSCMVGDKTDNVQVARGSLIVPSIVCLPHRLHQPRYLRPGPILSGTSRRQEIREELHDLRSGTTCLFGSAVRHESYHLFPVHHGCRSSVPTKDHQGHV